MVSAFQSAKLFLVQLTDLGKDALHVYVGLAVFLGAAALFRLPLRDLRLLLAVLVAALLGELWDVLDTNAAGGRPAWGRNGKDVWNTLFWPAVLCLLARTTRVLRP